MRSRRNRGTNHKYQLPWLSGEYNTPWDCLYSRPWKSYGSMMVGNLGAATWNKYFMNKCHLQWAKAGVCVWSCLYRSPSCSRYDKNSSFGLLMSQVLLTRRVQICANVLRKENPPPTQLRLVRLPQLSTVHSILIGCGRFSVLIRCLLRNARKFSAYTFGTAACTCC